MSDIEREAFERIERHFNSGNTVKVEQSVIKRADWILAKGHIKACRQALSSCSEIPNSSDHITDAGEMVGSRQALEGEPAMWSLSFNGKPANHFTTYPTRGKAEDYIARCKIGEKEPEKVNIEVVPLYTHPASADKWIKCSEQRPNVLDVWIKMTDGSVVACWSQLDGDFYWKGGGFESYILENTVTHWKPRQQEQGHECIDFKRGQGDE